VPITDLQLQSLARDAMQRAAAGDYAGAEPLFAQVVAARPNSGQALHLLGQARLKLGRFAEAREPLERAAKFLPREVAAQVNYAGCLTVLGEHEASLWAFDRAAKLNPGDPVIAHNRGRALEALGRLEEAERCYDDALAADHRLMPSLIARAGLLEARGDWMGALADLDMALVNRPDDARLRLRRGELLLQQGDWMRGLPDYEARLEIAGECYAPDLPRWQGEPVDGRLLIYPEQLDIESDAARRDTLMLARGVDAVVQCGETLAALLDGPTIRRGEPLAGFSAAAPLRSLPYLLGWSADAPPPPPALHDRDSGSPNDPVVGEDSWETHLAACSGVATTIRLRAKPDWLWGKQDGASPWYRSLELVRWPA
jgi:tetratricopeptide (TPR) repeat protein